MARIGVFFAEGYEEIEALTVVDLCRRAGIEVCMVSVDGSETATGSHGIGVKMDAALAQVDFDTLDMIVLPGGMPGTKNLEKDDRLMAQLDSFYDNGKWIAAICAAPSIFAHRGYLKGRKATCYPSFEKELAEAGVALAGTSAAEDGKVITGQAMGGAIDFGLKIVEKLISPEAADKLAESIVYER
ncbi:MAG: DJ-1/PfpI family protein [Eubacteriales bacterium]|nr:DJ-1/PfpI family protein [Eubacteriales bacterium]